MMPNKWLSYLKWAYWAIFLMLFCKIGLMPAYADTPIQAPTQVFIQSPSAINPSCFSDQDLSNTHQALIYVWSPRMVLSALEANNAAEQARQFSYAFIPVVDGRLPEQEWQAALSSLKNLAPLSAQVLATSQALCATGLIHNLAYRHFPTAYLVEQGKTAGHPIVGAMPSEFWHMAIEQRRMLAAPTIPLTH
jgi:hypothetical protein